MIGVSLLDAALSSSTKYDKKQLGSHLLHLLSSGLAPPVVVTELLTCLFDAFPLNSSFAAADALVIKEVASSLLRFCAQRYPLLFEECSRSIRQEARDLIREAFVNLPHALATSSGSSLLVALRSPVESIAAEALQSFEQTVDLSGDTDEYLRALADAACDKLHEAANSGSSKGWRPNVVAGVARHASEGSLLRACVTFWEVASGLIARNHSEADKMILALLTCLAEEPSIASCLCSSKLSLGASGRTWLLTRLCSTAQGAFNRMHSLQDSIPQELQAAAIASAKMCSAQYELFSCLLTDSSMRKKTTIDLLPRCLATLAEDKPDVFMHTLSDLTSGEVLMSLPFALAIANMIDLASSSITSSAAQSAMLSIYAPFLLVLVPRCVEDSDAEECSRYLEHLIAMLPVEASSFTDIATLSGYLTSLKQLITTKSMATQILYTLLGEAHVLIAKLLEPLIRRHFSSYSEAALISVAFNSSSTTTCKLCSIVALSSFVSSISESTCVSSFVNHQLKFEIASSLIFCVPIAIESCSSTNQALRSAGRELAETFTHLSKKFTIDFSGYEASGFPPSLKVKEVKLLMETLSFQEEIKDAEMSEACKDLLVCLLSLFGSDFPQTSASLFSCLGKGLSLPQIGRLVLAYLAGSVSADSILWNAIFRCIDSTEDEDKESLAPILTLLLDLLLKGNSPSLRRCLLAKYRTSWWRFTSISRQADLYSALISVQVNHPGQSDILLALADVEIDPEKVLEEFMNSYTAFIQDCGLEKTRRDSAEDAMTDHEEEEPEASVLPIQRFTSMLECMPGQLKRCTNLRILSTIFVASMDSLILLNDQCFRSVSLCEYTKTVVFDVLTAILKSGGEALVQAEENSVSKKKKKSAEKEEVVAQASRYTKSRVHSDIEQVLAAIRWSKTSTLQLSALNVVELLFDYVPTVAEEFIHNLGALLTLSASDAVLIQSGLEKGGFIETMLRKIHDIMRRDEEGFSPQKMLQPLCFYFTSLTSAQRGALVKIATNILGSSSLPAAVSVLLVHSLVAYDPEEIQSHISTSQDEEAADTFILLSRSSQRKALRQLRTYKSEDMFKLALALTLKKPVEVQVSAVVDALRSAQSLVSQIALAHAAVVTTEVPSCSVNVASLVPYTSEVLSTLKPDQKQTEKGVSAFLLLLHLEFVFEALESPAFHRSLALHSHDDNEEGALAIQKLLVEVVQEVLELLALVSDEVRDEDFSFHLLVGSQELEMSYSALAKRAYEWGLTIIRAIQRLLDGPSFIAVLQEMLDHDQTEVRQKAVQMLADRFADLGPSDSHEVIPF